MRPHATIAPHSGVGALAPKPMKLKTRQQQHRQPQVQADANDDRVYRVGQNVPNDDGEIGSAHGLGGGDEFHLG